MPAPRLPHSFNHLFLAGASTLLAQFRSCGGEILQRPGNAQTSRPKA
jgi:hypothetical protein